MERPRKQPKPVVVQALVATAGFLLFAGLYLALMHLTVGVSQLEPGEAADHRDRVYLAIHSGVALISLFGGFAMGKWLNGLGLGYALLLFGLVVTMMVAAQFASFSLACHGENDLLRHWEC